MMVHPQHRRTTIRGRQGRYSSILRRQGGGQQEYKVETVKGISDSIYFIVALLEAWE
jgi:hypothetical protein